MKRTLTQWLAVVLLLTAGPANAGTSFTETFDTQTYADTLDPAILWDTAAGELTLQPFQMTSVGSLTGMPGNSVDMVIRGNTLFMVAQNASVILMDIQNAVTPSLIALWNYGTVNGLDVKGDLAALATTNGTWLLDVTNTSVPSILWSQLGETVGAIELVGNRAYLALNDSLRILDVSNPAAPVWLGSVSLAGGAYRMAIQGGYAYCARGADLSIVDVSDPTNPSLVAVDSNNGGAFVDVQVDGDHAYASIVDVGVRSYDVTDPTNPTTLATYSPGNFVYGLALSGSSLYVAWRSDGVIHLDVSDPSNPTVVSTFDTPGFADGVAVASRQTFVADGTGLQVLQNGGPSLTGLRWYFADGDPQKVAVQGEYAYLAEDTNGLSIVSVRRSDYGSPVGHLPLTDALDVTVDGDYAYVANGGDGLNIVDVSDPTTPLTVFSFPAGTFSSYSQVELAGHLLFTRITGLTGGVVQIWDVSDPTATTPLGAFGGGSLAGLSIDGGLAALTSSGALQLYDVTDPNSPSSIGSIPFVGTVTVSDIEGDVLYLAGGNRVQSWDISDPTSPALIDTVSHTGTTRDFSLEHNYMWLATDSHNWLRVDVSDPAALAVGISTPGAAQGVVVRGDEIFMALDNGRLEVWRTTNRRYSNPEANATSSNINPLPDQVVGARLTPTHTRVMSFELSADGASTTINADSSEWEFFPTPGSDLRWIATPNAYIPGTYPAMSELTVDMLYEFGQIETIADVGNDQGRSVRLSWTRSGYDDVGSANPIVEYAIYRQQEAGLAPTARVLDPFAPQLAGWDYVASVPAETEDVYSVVVPTLADSTAGSGIVYTTFMVRARTGTPGVHYDSSPDSGYSVDNLAPMVPAGALANYGTGSGNQLSWDPPLDEDFQYFRIYRDTDPNFTPGPGNLVDATTANGWTDPTYDTGGVFYKLSAVDFSGNESDFAAPSGPTVGVEDGGLPRALQFYPGAPNPFRSATTLRFALPVDAKVELSVYDITGRRVRTLAKGSFDAGIHTIRWNGRDDAGRTLPPGLYLTRFNGNGVLRTQRVVRVD